MKRCDEHAEELGRIKEHILLDLEIDWRKVRQGRHLSYALPERRYGELLRTDDRAVRHLGIEVAQKRGVIGLERFAELLHMPDIHVAIVRVHALQSEQMYRYSPLVHIVHIER